MFGNIVMDKGEGAIVRNCMRRLIKLYLVFMLSMVVCANVFSAETYFRGLQQDDILQVLELLGSPEKDNIWQIISGGLGESIHSQVKSIKVVTFPKEWPANVCEISISYFSSRDSSDVWQRSGNAKYYRIHNEAPSCEQDNDIGSYIVISNPTIDHVIFTALINLLRDHEYEIKSEFNFPNEDLIKRINSISLKDNEIYSVVLKNQNCITTLAVTKLNNLYKLQNYSKDDLKCYQ